MPINTPAQIKFSNTIVRGIANVLVRIYNRGGELSDNWVAAGANQTALDAFRTEFTEVGRVFETAYLFCTRGVQMDDTFGSPIPNTTEIVEDGADPNTNGRLVITGEDANAIIVLGQEYLNVLLKGNFNGTGNNDAGMRRMFIAANQRSEDLTLTQASNFITVVDGIIAEYQANSKAKLIQLLKVSTLKENPNGAGN